MKLTAATVLASCAPSLAFALVGITWSIPGVPSTGLNSVTFPLSLAQTPHETGYYFAQQFNFVGQQDVGYTGLQPRPDANGRPAIHAVFSSFIAGTTTNDANCGSGADGGPGVSCGVEFSAPYSNGYNLEIVNTGGTTWTGTAVDSTTGDRVHIGTYTLPAGTQGIKGSQVGFVEYYPWNSGTHTCSSLPYAYVTFGYPVSPSGIGSLGDAYEYGDCVGNVAFKNSRSAGGIDVQVGFNPGTARN
ncbi:hypothetical protein BGZ99_004441 [Dissophora globulifera]|uniref:Uncharacterized protein n=1 Tax=Dissophora globulifera TaxID=979702 RepID=A0A9P6RHQ7_9FUNG|nr:hypothetical protein BGZ99_004441 [Dissophora globulifera]